MKKFLINSLKSLNQTGTIAPSSKHLINKIVSKVDFKPNQHIIEFGAGDGCITEGILSKLGENSKLSSFEINDYFYDYCTTKFKEESRLKLVKESAFEFDEVLNLTEDNSVDYFISSLPLSILNQKDVDRLIHKVNLKLKPNGKFIQYQYSLNKYFFFKKRFNNVHLDFTARNIPPAFVYICE